MSDANKDIDAGPRSSSAPSPDSPQRAPGAASHEDQLPTMRMPSIFPELPPIMPPPLNRTAYATQPLRPVIVDTVPTNNAQSAHVKRASWTEALRVKRRWWQALALRMSNAAPTRFEAAPVVRDEAWWRRTIGLGGGIVGLILIFASIAFGYDAFASDRAGGAEHVAIAVAIVLARTAVAIAAMYVGLAMLRMAERLCASDVREERTSRRSEIRELREPVRGLEDMSAQSRR